MFDERYLEYIELFNERYFYDCHEVLEDLWLDVEGESRRFYQGLIHLAAAFLHLFRGNMRGFAGRLKTTRLHLQIYPSQYEGLDLGVILTAIGYWENQLATHTDGDRLRYDDSHVPKFELV